MSVVLHVGPAVYEWLRDLGRRVEANPALIAAAPGDYGGLSDIPVVVEYHDWHPGRWEVRDGDDVTATGQVGDDDQPVIYIPGYGWIGCRAQEAATQAAHLPEPTWEHDRALWPPYRLGSPFYPKVKPPPHPPDAFRVTGV